MLCVGFDLGSAISSLAALNDVDLNAPHPRLSSGDQEQAERDDAECVAGVDGAWRAHGLRVGGLSRRHVGESRDSYLCSVEGGGDNRSES